MKNKKKIFIVEDEDALLRAISKKLVVKGIEPVVFSNGEKALDYLKNSSELPDLIWLDYYLGEGMNGASVLIKIKENSKWQKIPVVIVSNTASLNKIHTMLEMGAKKYIVKVEHKLDEIVDEVLKFLPSEQAD